MGHDAVCRVQTKVVMRKTHSLLGLARNNSINQVKERIFYTI